MDEVMVTIASTGEDKHFSQLGNSSSPSPALEILNSTFPSSHSPEIATTLTKRRLFSTNSVSKPKSRFEEPPSHRDVKLADENAPFVKSTPTAPETDDDDEGVYLKVCGLKVSVFMFVELIAFVCIMGALISSLTVDTLKEKVIWGLRLWKWCVLVWVIFCGRLFSVWSINILVFLFERNFLFKNKVLYFIHGVKTSVKVFIWLALVLLTWSLLISRGVERSKDTIRILSYVTRALGACLIGAAIWLVKTLLVKIIASNYQCSRFFEPIQDAFFHQYVVSKLSGPPTIETGHAPEKSKCCTGLFRFINTKKEKQGENDEEKLHKVKRGKVSAWTMKECIEAVMGSGLSTISNTPGRCHDNTGELQNEEIVSQKQAKIVADQIFINVAGQEAENMEEKDLLHFIKSENIERVLGLFGATKTRKIRKSDFENWLVKVYVERKSLAHSLDDSKTAIEELNRLLSAIVLVLAVIVWFLMMGFLTTQVIVLISSQLLLAAFMFGNAAKTVFEAIIFVFVMHPFDVLDRCVIDGVQMVVEEMNILTTIFLRYDGEKIFYPNSVLLTKPISNFNRSPKMGDAVEFDVHISTTTESISALDAKIKEYLKSKAEHWQAEYSLLVKEIEDVNKMKMALYVTHTINFQEFGVKNGRRSELMLELKKWFEELGIKYHLLPQEVHLRRLG